MNENIEDTKPIDALAARVWGGMRWYYPHIERMVADMKELRSENARLRQIAIAAKLMTEAVTRCPKTVAPCGQTIHSILGNTQYNNVPHTLMDDFLELFMEYQMDHGEEIARQAVAGGGE